MNPGSHEHPVRPKGAGRKRPYIPPAKRSPITYRGHDDERAVWLLRRSK